MTGVDRHALLGPSGAQKWLNCPRAPRLEETIPEEPSPYAETGRLAHALGELELKKKFTTSIKPSEYKKKLAELRKQPQYEKSMDRAVAAYVDYVTQLVYSMSAMPTIAIEREVDLSAWAPESFGTADCILISGTDLHVIDFKNGSGVAVSADNNPQLMLYGLGALDRYRAFYSIETVHLAIVQPNGGGISEWSVPVADLLRWGEKVVKPAAQKAFAGVGDFNPGVWCDKGFCRAAGQCRARAEKFEAVIRDNAGKDPDLLDNNEIGRILEAAKGFEPWLKKINGLALKKTLAGETVPGWKAVEGTSRRVIPDENVPLIEKVLIEAGYKKAALYTRKLLGITELENLVGKKELSELAGQYIEKPEGKPTLVPESDRRPPFNTQQSIESMFGKGE